MAAPWSIFSWRIPRTEEPGSLAGYSPWGCKESDATETTRSLGSRGMLWKQDCVLQVLVILTVNICLCLLNTGLQIMSPLLPPHKSVCTPFFAMKSPNSRILCVVHHALGLRHFLALKLKHYKMGVQWYRSKSIRFHSNLKVFPTCGSLCHSFSLRSPYWPLELFLFWTVTFTDCLLQIPFGMTFPSLYWAEYPPNKDYWFHFFFFLLPSLRKPICFRSAAIFFFRQWFTHWPPAPSNPTFLPVFWWWHPLPTLSVENNKH